MSSIWADWTFVLFVVGLVCTAYMWNITPLDPRETKYNPYCVYRWFDNKDLLSFEDVWIQTWVRLLCSDLRVLFNQTEQGRCEKKNPLNQKGNVPTKNSVEAFILAFSEIWKVFSHSERESCGFHPSLTYEWMFFSVHMWLLF